MEIDNRKFLHDIIRAGRDIEAFTSNLGFDSYSADRMVKAAVERKFEILGEAMNRIHKNSPATAESIRNYKKVIAFRNILIHGYDAVSDPIVWDVVQNSLPDLIEDVEGLLNS